MGISWSDIKKMGEDALNKYNVSKVADARSVWLQVAAMSAVSLATIIVFSILRPRNKVVYAPKIKQRVKGAEDIQPLDDGIFSWVKPLFQYKEKDLVPKIGLDAVTYLRFLRMLRNGFALTVILTCGILLPVNYVYNNKHVDGHDKSWLTATTMQNVYDRKWLWPHVAVSYCINMIFMVLIWFNYRAMVRLRWDWFRSEEYQSSLYARTLMITSVPRKLMSDSGLLSILKPDPESKQKFAIPYDLTSAHIGRRVGHLPLLVEKHNDAVRRLEQVLVSYFKKGTLEGRKRPTKTVGGFLGMGGEKVDAIKYYSEKIRRFESEIEAWRAEIDSKKPEKYGFATLAAVPFAHVVASKLESKHPRGTTITLAPNPKDLIFENLHDTPSAAQKATGWALLAAVCFLNTIPLLVISFLANLSYATAYSTSLENWQDSSPWSFSAVAGILPPVVAALFGWLLPHIMRRLSQYQGAVTQSRLDRAVVARFFAFLIISQLFIFTLLGTVFNLVSDVVRMYSGKAEGFQGVWDAVEKIAIKIRDAYVSQGSYWLKWFPMRGFLAFFDLAQLLNLFIVWIKTHLFGRTPRDIKEWTYPPDFEYAIYYSNMLFTATVGLVYAPIAPLVSAAALAVFAIFGVVYKYQLMFVFVTQVESGGRVWNMIVNRLLFSLIAMQAIMILSMGLASGWYYAIAAIPPIFVVLIFKLVLTRKFDKVFRYYLPTEEEMAGSKIHSEKSDVKRNRLEKRFGHPALHAELFSIQIHQKDEHLLAQVLPGRAHRHSVGGKEDIHMGGLKFEAVTEQELEEAQVERDRGEQDWDARSLASTTLEGLDRGATPAPSISGMLKQQYLAHGPGYAPAPMASREDIELSSMDSYSSAADRPLVANAAAPSGFGAQRPPFARNYTSASDLEIEPLTAGGRTSPPEQPYDAPPPGRFTPSEGRGSPAPAYSSPPQRYGAMSPEQRFGTPPLRYGSTSPEQQWNTAHGRAPSYTSQPQRGYTPPDGTRRGDGW